MKITKLKDLLSKRRDNIYTRLDGIDRRFRSVENGVLNYWIVGFSVACALIVSLLTLLK